MVRVPIESIKVQQDRRKHPDTSIESLAESIREIGLLHPIVVLPDNTLVAGMGRLEACKRLGWTEIEATVKDFTKPEVVLAMHMENMRRCDYRMVENAMALAECKEAYERLKDELARKPREQQPRDDAEEPLAVSSLHEAARQGVRFDEAVAENLGVSPRTVRRSMFVAKNIHQSVRDAVNSLKLQYTRREIEELAKMCADDQKSVAELLLSREYSRITDAMNKVSGDVRLDKNLRLSIERSDSFIKKEDADMLARLPSRIQRQVAQSLRNGIPLKDALAEVRVHDASNHRVPNDLVARWIATKQLTENWAKQLTMLLKDIRQFASTINGRYIDVQTLQRDIANCVHAIRFGAPYVVCKTCKGSGCDLCRNTGWMPRHSLTRNATAGEVDAIEKELDAASKPGEPSDQGSPACAQLPAELTEVA